MGILLTAAFRTSSPISKAGRSTGSRTPMLRSSRASVPRLALMLLPVPSAATAAAAAVVVVAAVVAAVVVVERILWVSETKSPVR